MGLTFYAVRADGEIVELGKATSHVCSLYLYEWAQGMYVRILDENDDVVIALDPEANAMNLQELMHKYPRSAR